MLNSNIQYINIIRSQQNIKLNYQILQNNSIIKNEQSIFLMEDNHLSLDTNYKLQTLEQSNSNTYICAICEDENQTIISKNENTPNHHNTTISFDHSHIISLDNDIINSNKKFFNNGEIDYLISPFNILNTVLHENLKENSLNMLILNNKIYVIILDNDKRYTFSCIEQLTPYEDVKNSDFFTDNIVEQKLYDEIYTLELNEKISDITKKFYEKNDATTFIQTVNIFYHIKQLNDEQLNTLKETLMMDINYTQIQLEDIVLNISKKPSIKSQSFIKARKKKMSFSFGFWLIISLLTTLIALSIVYLLRDNIKDIKEDKPKIKITKKIEKKPIKKVIVIKEILLPNHNEENLYKSNIILDIFETISDEAVLKEIQLQKDESTLIYTFRDPDSYENFLKPKILKIYENSENILTSKNNGIYTAIISNTVLKKQPTKTEMKKYINKKFLNKNDSISLLNKIFNKKIFIQYISTDKTKYITHVFALTMKVNSPKYFFDMIDKISNQKYSIVLSYPIEFAKTNNGLEVSFLIKIYQNKPLQKSKKDI